MTSFNPRRVACSLACVVALFVSIGMVDADPTDADRTLFARDLIHSDPDLKSLGARVDGEVGEVWGTVPSRDLVVRAERLMLTVPGVRSVRNDVRIVPKPDPAIAKVAQLVRGDVPPNEPLPHVASPTVLVSSTPRKPTKPTVHVSLFPPEEPMITAITIPVARSVEKDDMPTRLSAILRADTRFQRLALQMTDNDIRVTGNVAKGSHIWEVAERLADVAEGRRIDVSRIVSLAP